MSTYISSAGLVLDIIGAVLIWRFGLPPSVRREGHSYLLLEGTDEAEKAKAARYDRYGQIGIGLLITGFLLQLVGNLWK